MTLLPPSLPSPPLLPVNSNYYCLGAKEVSTPHQLDRGAMTLHLTAKSVKLQF